MIKNIIFDFGGVVLKHRNDIMEEAIFKMFSVSFEQASKIWKENKAELITGRMSSVDFLAGLKKRLNTKPSQKELMIMWRDFYRKEARGVNWKMLEFVGELKKKYKVYLFTDTIDVHNDYNRTRNIYNRFDRVFISFKEKTIKSEKTAFLNVLKKIGADANKCFYIDDLEENVKVAESIGIKAVVFKSLEQLRKLDLLTR